MKSFTMILAVFLAFAAVPVLSFGSSCEDHGKHSEGGQKMAATHDGHAGHGGMDAAGSMLDLGSVTVNGIEGMAHMKDVRAAMAKMGMKTTHHFMVMFNEEKTGRPVESGKVAVKIISPDGTVTGPLELMGMQGHFGADVTLDKPGEYRFQVGSRLADGATRQFEFRVTLR